MKPPQLPVEPNFGKFQNDGGKIFRYRAGKTARNSRNYAVKIWSSHPPQLNGSLSTTNVKTIIHGNAIWCAPGGWYDGRAPASRIIDSRARHFSSLPRRQFNRDRLNLIRSSFLFISRESSDIISSTRLINFPRSRLFLGYLAKSQLKNVWKIINHNSRTGDALRLMGINFPF